MFMVEIDSNTILVEPINALTYAELTRSYIPMMLHPMHAGIITQNHILDNEVSTSIKTLIHD